MPCCQGATTDGVGRENRHEGGDVAIEVQPPVCQRSWSVSGGSPPELWTFDNTPMKRLWPHSYVLPGGRSLKRFWATPRQRAAFATNRLPKGELRTSSEIALLPHGRTFRFAPMSAIWAGFIVPRDRTFQAPSDRSLLDHEPTLGVRSEAHNRTQARPFEAP